MSPAPPRRPQRAVDRAWPALPLIALGLAVVVAVVGVLAAPREGDLARIDDAVHDFARAVQEQRGEDACALLTPAARRAVAQRLGTVGCAGTVRSFGIGLDAGRLRVATVREATITGDRAGVAREQLVLPDGAPYRGGLTLERAGGGWLLATLP